jgi:hypothetical protein
VLGVVLLFIIPWFGLAGGIVGLILAILYISGIDRRAAEPNV